MDQSRERIPNKSKGGVGLKNTTKIKVPKKYESMIAVVFEDQDGYWVGTEPGFRLVDPDQCGSVHEWGEDTQKELLAVIRSVAPCECSDCLISQGLIERRAKKSAEREALRQDIEEVNR